MPQFSVDASYNRLDNGKNVGTSGVTTPNYQLAMRLALPSGFNAASQWLSVSAARAQSAASRQALAVTERQIRSEVHSAAINLEDGVITNMKTAKQYSFVKPPAFLLEYIRLGGLVPYLLQVTAAAESENR